MKGLKSSNTSPIAMIRILLIFPLFLFYSHVKALPMYDEGARLVNGVQLLRHKDYDDQFYYIPQFPHLSSNNRGDFELLCTKYIGNQNVSNGGLFHALIDFTLPDEVLKEIEKELQKQAPGATIIGPVKLLESKPGLNDDVQPSFEIVSAILNNQEGKNAFTTNLVASGHAPFSPGSKAAVAALLSQEGATLLWDSFNGANSDVSVTVNGYYEAFVNGYGVTVTADMSVIYNHFSEITNEQSGYQKSQIRNIVDSLVTDGSITVEKFDRSATLDIDASDLENILNIVTNKLVEVMFDTETGWSQTPEKVDATMGFDERGRQGDRSEAGQIVNDVGNILCKLSIVGLFQDCSSDENPEYVTDSQYVLKNISDVRISKFYMNLTAGTTIKVPVHASGNLGGIYDNFANNKKYFRIIDLNDADFQKRQINFHVDGAYIPGFKELINFVSINFRKSYPETAHQDDIIKSINITSDQIENGKLFSSCEYPRFGIDSKDFSKYEYQIVWSLKGGDNVIRFPENEDDWISTQTADVVLTIPFEQTELVVDADRQSFTENEFKSATVTFATKRAGKASIVRNVILRAGDEDNTNKLFLYRDPQEPIVYKVNWYGANKEFESELKELKDTYLFLTPPQTD